MNKQFIKEAKEVRESFVEIAGQYSISDNLKLRTEIDSLLIMYDQALQMLSERQTTTEVSENHDSKALHIADVMHRFSPNDVDGAYLLGVFNVSGIDGLQAEIQRLKELKVNPHNIMDSIKSNGA